MEQDNGRENFRIGLDTEQLDHDAQGARAAFESLGAAAEGVGKQIDQSLGKTDASALRKEMAETEKAIKDVQECIAANSREVEEFKNKIQAAQAQLANGGDKDTLTAQVQGYRDTIAQLTNDSKSLTSEHSNLQASLARMGEQWAQLSVEAQQAAIAEQEAAEASNAVTHASATANISEGVATNANTGAIAAKAVAESKAAETTAQATAATQQAAQEQNQQAAATQAVTEKLKSQASQFDGLNAMTERFIETIKRGEATEESYRRTRGAADSERLALESRLIHLQEQENALNTERTQTYLRLYEAQKNGVDTSSASEAYESARTALLAYQREVESIEAEIRQLTRSIEALDEAYRSSIQATDKKAESATKAAASAQESTAATTKAAEQEASAIEKSREAIKQKEEELERYKAQLAEMQSQHSIGGFLGSFWNELTKEKETSAGTGIPELKAAIAAYKDAGVAASDTKQIVAALEAELQSLIQQYEKANNTIYASVEAQKLYKQIIEGSDLALSRQKKTVGDNAEWQKAAEEVRKYAEEYARLVALRKDGKATDAAVDAAAQKYGAATEQLEKIYQEQKKLAEATSNTTKKIDEAGNAHTRASEKAKAYKQEAQKIPTVHNQIADTMKTIGALTMGYFSVKGIENFIQKCIEVRKNLELMEVRFQGLMGDAGTELLGDIKQMAMDSGVYTTKALSEVAQTLNVYGIETEQIMPLLREFGDVAMGNEQKLSSLAMAFGRLETQGQLSSLTLRTFTRAGFNPLEEMARKTGKSMQQLRTEMSAGLITTQKVKDALKSATSQGGKFYNMTENISGSIAAEQGRLQQMITKIYAEWGKSHEDMIKGGYQFAQTLVANYEAIGKTIGTLIAVYGTYRACLLVNNVLESTRIAALARLIRMQGLATTAQHALNAACKANPYVLLATVVLSLGAAFAIWTKKADANVRAQERSKQITDEVTAAQQKRRNAIDNMLASLNNASDSEENHVKNLQGLKKEYPNILKGINTYNDYLRDQVRIEKEISAAQAYEPVAKAKKVRDNYKIEVDEAQSEVNKAKAAYDVASSLDGEDAAVAVRAAYTTLTLANNKLAAAQKEYKKHDDAYKKQKKDYETTIAEAEKQRNVKNKSYFEKQKQSAQATLEAMDISQKGSKEWTKAYNEFMEADKKLQTWSLQTNKQRDAAAAKAEKEEERKRKAELKQENLELDGKKKAAEALRNWNEKQAEMEAEAEWNRRQAVIDAMEEGSQKQLEQLRLNHDKEMAEIDREAKEMWKARIEYQKQIFEAKPENKHKDFYQSDIYKALLPEDEKHPLTKDEEDKLGLTAKRESSDAKYIRENKSILEAEQQAMQDYLKQYGTLQEQKLALDREYAEKRRKIMESSDTEEQKRWQLASLDQQHKSETSKLNAQSLAMNIDWGATFGDIGHVLGDVAKETLDRVEAYMKTAEFKSLSATDKQSYTTLRQNLKNEVGNNASVFNFGIWGDIQNDIRAYQASVKKLQDANAAHSVAVAQLAASEKKLAENTDETQQDFLKAMVDFNTKRVKQTESDVQNAQTESDNSKDNLESDADKAAAGLQNFQNVMQQLSSGSLKGFADGVTNLITNLTKTDDAAGAASKGLAGLGKVGGIVGAILSILDALGDDPARFISDLFEKIEKAIENIIADLPNLVGNIVSGVVNIVGGVFSGISQMFGGDAIGDIGVNDKSYEEDMERLRQSNTDLAYAIDSLAEIMADQAGAEATATYENQKADLEQREKNLQEDIIRSANRSSSGVLGIGSKGSTRRYINDNMSAADWEKVSQAAGVSVKDANEFFRLTSEQMHNVATYASAEWTKIMLHASDGMESIKDQLNEYIDLQSEADDALKNYQETLTSLSFDSLKDSMAELLESSETDTEDVIDNINKYLQKAIINTVLTKAGQDRLEAWYSSFAEAMSDGVMTATESAALRTSYAQIYDDVNKQYEAAMQAAGLDPEDFDDEDSGDSGSWESLGEETGRALEGRFAALQIQTTKIADIVAAQYEANTQGNTQRITALSEMNNLVFICSEHLERIASNTDALPRMEKKLENIKTNTDRL